MDIRITNHAFNRYIQRIRPHLAELERVQVYRAIKREIRKARPATAEELHFIRYSRPQPKTMSAEYNLGIQTYITTDYVAFVTVSVNAGKIKPEKPDKTILKTCFECQYLKILHNKK